MDKDTITEITASENGEADTETVDNADEVTDLWDLIAKMDDEDKEAENEDGNDDNGADTDTENNAEAHKGENSASDDTSSSDNKNNGEEQNGSENEKNGGHKADESGSADTEANTQTENAEKAESNVDYEAMAKADIEEINRIFGTSYTDLKEIPNYERFCDLRDNGKYSLTAEEAYKVIMPYANKTAPATKGHITASAPKHSASGYSNDEVEMTMDALGCDRAEAEKYLAKATRHTVKEK